jgi:hypothetical protein
MMARFYSKCKNYQILVTPTVIDVKNNIPVLRHGKKIEFKNGEFTTDDKKEIEFLRKHKAFGIDFVEDKTPTEDGAAV